MFPYNIYKFSLKRLWGSPITFTILPITFKDFPCNFIVVFLCIVFPYHFYKYGMYFPRKSLQTFTVYFSNSFHKTEVVMVILKGPTCQNLNWIKSYDINYKLFWQLCFSILEEKKAAKMAIFWPFVVFFWQLHRYISKNWDSDGHFEVLSVSKS